jgi:hypothetical protein
MSPTLLATRPFLLPHKPHLEQRLKHASETYCSFLARSREIAVNNADNPELETVRSESRGHPTGEVLNSGSYPSAPPRSPRHVQSFSFDRLHHDGGFPKGSPASGCMWSRPGGFGAEQPSPTKRHRRRPTQRTRDSVPSLDDTALAEQVSIPESSSPQEFTVSPAITGILGNYHDCLSPP